MKFRKLFCTHIHFAKSFTIDLSIFLRASENKTAEVKDEDEVVVENENAEDQEDEGSSSSSSEWQVVDETPEDKAQDMMSREQLEQDEETLGRDRDDAMAEEFDESRK